MVRRSSKWRSPAFLLDIDEAGFAAKFQRQTFEVARYCGRKQVGPQDVGDVEWNPASGGSDGMDVWPSPLPGRDSGGDP